MAGPPSRGVGDLQGALLRCAFPRALRCALEIDARDPDRIAITFLTPGENDPDEQAVKSALMGAIQGMARIGKTAPLRFTNRSYGLEASVAQDIGISEARTDKSLGRLKNQLARDRLKLEAGSKLTDRAGLEGLEPRAALRLLIRSQFPPEQE